MSNETQAFIDSIDTDKEKELVSIGSSLKICLVAEGGVDIYPRLGYTSEWDTGAAHAVINESKSELQSYSDGQYLKHVYNKKCLLKSFVSHFLFFKIKKLDFPANKVRYSKPAFMNCKSACFSKFSESVP